MFIRPGTHVKQGQVVQIATKIPQDARLVEPEQMPLDIVHEDEDIIIVHKPTALVCHPASTHRSGTLLNGLAYHVTANHTNHTSSSSSGDEPFVKLVHRIDKCTSGLLVAAKTRKALSKLSAAMEKGLIKRRYLALVKGDLAKDQVINLALARCDHACKVARVEPKKGSKEDRELTSHAGRAAQYRTAKTRVRVLERCDFDSFMFNVPMFPCVH